MENKIEKREEEWKEELTPEQYHVLREGGTEAPFSEEQNIESKNGVYDCAACGNELFHSDSKFESGSGWPSFSKTIKDENVTLKSDQRHGIDRTEVLCAKCESHLGHVFDDGPHPTGKRFCVNAVALNKKDK